VAVLLPNHLREKQVRDHERTLVNRFHISRHIFTVPLDPSTGR
jgi:hypothetical protein